MKALINIHGTIGEDVKLTDIVSQMNAFPEPTEMEVNIQSVGGFVADGKEIYDYLDSFDIPKTTIAEKICASVATKLMLLGDTRKVAKGTKFMIHNPFLRDVKGDADMLLQLSGKLKEVENEFLSFYSEKLNQPAIAIQPLMKRETYLNEDELLALGFATEIINGIESKEEFRAVAKLEEIEKLTLNKQTMQIDEKSKQDLLTRIENSISKFLKPKAQLELADANGDLIVFPNLEPEQKPSIGDAVSAEDGSYTFGEMTITVEDRTVTDVVVTEAVDEEKEQMKKELEAKEKELEEMKAQISAKEEKEKEIEAEMEKIRAMVSDFPVDKKPQPQGKAPEDGKPNQTYSAKGKVAGKL